MFVVKLFFFSSFSNFFFSLLFRRVLFVAKHPRGTFVCHCRVVCARVIFGKTRANVIMGAVRRCTAQKKITPENVGIRRVRVFLRNTEFNPTAATIRPFIFIYFTCIRVLCGFIIIFFFPFWFSLVYRCSLFASSRQSGRPPHHL